MSTVQTQQLSLVKRFLKAIGEEGKSGDDLKEFYGDHILQTEYPNAVTKNVTTRDIEALKEGSEKGKKLFLKQDYELLHAYEQANTVVIEAIWRGTLAIPLGNLPAGGEMKAYFAQFFEFEQGKIVRQRNYDCFEPFQ